jgi:hypothetical protein
MVGFLVVLLFVQLQTITCLLIGDPQKKIRWRRTIDEARWLMCSTKEEDL